jgi:hypothetical protein
MSKQHRSNVPQAGFLPSTGATSLPMKASPQQQAAEAESQQVNPSDSSEPISVLSSTGMLEVPMLDAGEIGFVRRHLNVKLNAKQANALKSIALALHAKGEKLESGRRVEGIATAAQWVFENLAK